MTSKKPDAVETLRQFLDALAESVAELPDADVLAEARAAGEDPVAIGAQMRAIALDAAKTASQEKLRAARAAYLRERERLGVRRGALPSTADERRRLLDATLHRRPELRNALTLAARDLTGVPDEDVESLLRQLAALGALEESSRKDDP